MSWRYQIVKNKNGIYELVERYTFGSDCGYASSALRYEYRSRSSLINDLETMLADAKKYKTERV